MTRHFWVLVHRYAGLYMAFFLTVAGLTGSVLAFYHELDGWLNPARYQVTVQNQPMLDDFILREKALVLTPHAQINSVGFNRQPGQVYEAVVIPVIDPVTNKPYELGYNTVQLNPYNGELIEFGKDEGLWPLNRRNILSFIYSLHYSLALGEVGVWLFGIAALIWTADCFVGFYLTLPGRGRKLGGITNAYPETAKAKAFSEGQGGGDDEGVYHLRANRSFGSRWAVAWKIKWPASTYRINFDLHRAGGLWTWVMLFIFAWSSVMFNLGQQVYIPVMKQFFEMTDGTVLPVPNLQQPRPDPIIDFKTAYQTGQRLMTRQAQQKRFKVLEEAGISYDPAKGLYSYTVKSDYDMSKFGRTILWLDGISGAFVGLYLPTGQKAGDTITYWLQDLHMAHVWGLPFQIFVCLMGLVVAMLSITGVYIWLKKRRARCLSKERKIRLAEETHA